MPMCVKILTVRVEKMSGNFGDTPMHTHPFLVQRQEKATSHLNLTVACSVLDVVPVSMLCCSAVSMSCGHRCNC